MTMIIGNQVEVGLGMESLAAPGVAVAESLFIPWSDVSMQAVVEKEAYMAARGLRVNNSNSIIKRKYGKGSIGCSANIQSLPYFLSLLLGSCSTATASGETIVYEHTFTMQNTNSSVRTATVTIKQGGIQVQQFLGCVLEDFALEVSDSFAKVTVGLLGGYVGSDTETPSYSNQTEFAYHNLSAKFGTSLSNAAGQTATPLSSFKLSAKANIQDKAAFRSGASTPIAGAFVPGRMAITGSYSLPFESTTELNKYLANTENAGIFTFTGGAIGVAEFEECTLKIGKMILTKEPITFSQDGVIMIEQEFEVRYDSTDKELQAVVTNLVANASNAVYAPA